MNNFLKEELSNFRKLSNYNPKMTLSENISELGEASFGLNPATTAREVETAIGKNLENFMRELKLTTKSVSEVTALLEKDVKAFEKEFAKAIETDLKANFPKGVMGPAAKEMSKIDVMRRLAVESKGVKLKPKQIKTIIEDTAAANKLKVSGYTPKTPRTPKPKPNPADVEQTVLKYPWMKNLTWKLLLKRGLQIGIPLAVLYGIYKLTHDDEPPTPTPTPTPNPDPNTDRYRVCTGTYTKGCKTDPTGAIGQVQKCLGLVVDGKFWDKTQSALVAKGFVNGFKDSDITKICGGNTPTPPTPTTPTPTPTPSTEEDYGVTPQPNAQAEVQTTNDDINNY